MHYEQEMEQLRKEIKQQKKKFRLLDKLNREEVKTNKADFNSMYMMSKQVERLKSHLNQIKSNRKIQ